MKIVSILGTRPEIIRLSRILPLLDAHCDRHVILNTGQNYSPELNESFLRELGLRNPDYLLDVKADSVGRQIGNILAGCEEVLQREKPDRVLMLGDTNSALAAIMAKRMGIPVLHMEAGNRCYDDRVPEEVNRRIIDHSSAVLLPYTEHSRRNLLAEGIPGQRIQVTGNPIWEVIQHYRPHIDGSDILTKLGLTPKGYILVTLHREENVDSPERLRDFMTGFAEAANTYDCPVIISTHPRTRTRLAAQGDRINHPRVHWLNPFGFFDFVHLEQHALAVMTDSGTVQEETCLLQVPNVTLRDVTERPETVECGSNLLTGSSPAAMARALNVAISRPATWNIPPEYLKHDVSDTVLRICLNHRLA